MIRRVNAKRAIGSLLTATLTLAAVEAFAGEPSGCTSLDAVASTPAVDFGSDIQPIFEAHRCASCHQPDSSGDLNLLPGAAWDSLVEQPSSRNLGELLVDPFAPDRSVLFHSVNCDDPGGPFFRMGSLSQQEQGLVRDWIAQGAHREPFVPTVPADVALREVFPADRFANALGLVNAGDGSGRLFVVRQDGVIETFARDGSVSDFMTVPSPLNFGGERGLLGLAFHPDFGSNGELW